MSSSIPTPGTITIRRHRQRASSSVAVADEDATRRVGLVTEVCISLVGRVPAKTDPQTVYVVIIADVLSE